MGRPETLFGMEDWNFFAGLLVGIESFVGGAQQILRLRPVPACGRQARRTGAGKKKRAGER